MAARVAGSRLVVVEDCGHMAPMERPRAVAGARDAVNALSPGDRASIVFFSSGAEVALRSASMIRCMSSAE